ncbi:MAG: Rne/Rng family ribonuclease [Puniceicoccales bacterium]|jgi:ribonuclease G|nr:Rne/Rng family ribonuclease [Puniceicoccales bacterium]
MDTAAGEDFLEEWEQPPSEISPEVIDGEQLIEEAKARAKKQPILQRILKNIVSSDGKFREIVMDRNFAETRLAFLVDGRMETFAVDTPMHQNWVGAIFKGRIQNLDPGLKAAFVITGQEKNAFLHYWDMMPAANDSFEILGKSSSNREITVNDIPKMYPVGTEILVQVTKAQMGTKGPRVTTNIALSGRYLVLTPLQEHWGISRKIESAQERERLKGILQSLTLPPGMGVVVRTAGAEKKLKHFIRDLSMLLKTWDEISKKLKTVDGPGLLYREPDLAGRAVRDFLTDDVDRIVTDSPELYAQIVRDINAVAPRMRSRVHLYAGPVPLFAAINVEKQIIQAFSRRVALQSGGEIVIEETEALTAIDVNTSSQRCEKANGDSYLLRVNLEAAEEIVRQMRLRNLGGLIIIDFIDMQDKADQRKLFQSMKAMMEKDTERFQILPISPLGIMQISRQRHSQSLFRNMRRPCPYCEGRGALELPQTTAMRVLNALMDVIKKSPKKVSTTPRQLRAIVHPDVLEFLKNTANDHLSNIEQNHGVSLTFSANNHIHREKFFIRSDES